MIHRAVIPTCRVEQAILSYRFSWRIVCDFGEWVINFLKRRFLFLSLFFIQSTFFFFLLFRRACRNGQRNVFQAKRRSARLHFSRSQIWVFAELRKFLSSGWNVRSSAPFKWIAQKSNATSSRVFPVFSFFFFLFPSELRSSRWSAAFIPSDSGSTFSSQTNFGEISQRPNVRRNGLARNFGYKCRRT